MDPPDVLETIMPQDRNLMDFLLDLEAPLRDLAGLIIALDLIVSEPEGIDKKDIPGAKVVAATARNLAEEIREIWRETVKLAKESRGMDEAEIEP